ncbi:MAG TPA: LuxR C-terminal-related transcriptional regulator [Ktedonobacterales bacterium]
MRAADALYEATGATVVWAQMPAWQSVGRLRERLEQEGLGATYREGRALPFGAVASLALSLLEEDARTLAGPETAPVAASPRPPTPPDGRAGPLSGREQEVLRLVAQGLSSKAIGQRLFLSASTVSQHLTSIFNKLGVATRAQAAAAAAQRGLL